MVIENNSLLIPNWTQHFDVAGHTAHGDDPNSRIMVFSENPQEDERMVDQLKNRMQCLWKVVDLTNLIQCQWNDVDLNGPNGILIKDIREGFRPTNIVLNFAHSINRVQSFEWAKGFKTILAETGLLNKVCYAWKCIMFLSLSNIYRDSMGGAYQDSRVPISQRWKLEIESLIEKGIIPTSSFKILVLSGTHGSNKDHGGNGEFFKYPFLALAKRIFLRQNFTNRT